MKRKPVFLLSTLAIVLILTFIFADTFILNVFGGRVRFPEKYIGQHLTMEDGRKFVVFRRVQIGGTTDNTTGHAVFKVRFQFKSLGPSINKRLSIIPTPFLIGMKGFREKCWTIDEKAGVFQGIYQWESKEFAERYPYSFVFRLMASRSAEGTLSYEIIPDTDLLRYIEKISSDHPFTKS